MKTLEEYIIDRIIKLECKIARLETQLEEAIYERDAAENNLKFILNQLEYTDASTCDGGYISLNIWNHHEEFETVKTIYNEYLYKDIEQAGDR